MTSEAQCPPTFESATHEQVEYVRKQLGTSEEDIKNAVGMLREWLRMQPHLPDNIDNKRIERMFINCKCSVERAKVGLDAYFSLKTRIPEVLLNRDPLGSDIEYAKQHVKILTMPGLTPEGFRVHLGLDIDPDPQTYRFVTHMKMALMMVELLMAEDYCLGDVFVIDLSTIGMGHLVSWDVNTLRNIIMCYKTAYCRRMKALHFVNAPKIVEIAVKIVKAAFSEKLQKRITVHLPQSETLFDHVPRNMIPNDLGGSGGPADQFNYQLFDRTKKYRNWFLEQDKYVADESKRPNGCQLPGDKFGIEGSFRKLAVD